MRASLPTTVRHGEARTFTWRSASSLRQLRRRRLAFGHVESVVTGLRRYAVKSMGGEALHRAELDERGLAGDRWYAVEDADGRFASGKNTRRFRRRDPVFDYAARTDGGTVLVTGPDGEWVVGDPHLDAALSARMGLTVRVRAEREVPHQDMGSVSMIGTATLDWCADRWGVDADARRLRPNIVVATSVPFVEETWVGRRLGIADVELEVVERVPRCRMIDIDQDGAMARGRWLKRLAAERDMFLAVYADVRTPGRISLGDEVEVI